MNAYPPTLGLILAGGLARRMGGGDKALLLLGGRTLLDHVVDRLRPQCLEMVVSANGDPARFGGIAAPVVPDGVAGFPGPLAGILAGLDWAAANRPDLRFVASAAADTPFLPADFVARLHAAREAAGTALACAASGGRAHPVAALWPVAIRDDLRRALLSDERRVGRVVDAHGCARAVWSEAEDPFFNVNEPADLDAARARLAASNRETGSLAERRLDLRGLNCPLPALRTRKALAQLAAGDALAVTCTDPMAAIDIPNLVRETGDTLVGTSRDGECLTFRITRGPAPGSGG